MRCLVRATSDRSRLPDGVEYVEGDVTSRKSMIEAVKDCFGVVHVGGVVKVRHKKDFYTVNRDGTENLVKAAQDEGVRRFVLCSSQAAGGPAHDDSRRKPDDTPEPVSEYGKSKLAGEDVLHKYAGDMWSCIIRPPAVYGPYDVAFLSFVRGVKYGVKLNIGSKNNKFALIHGADLARALILGLSADCSAGKIWYATDGADHRVEQLGTAVEKAMNRKAVNLNIPVRIARFTAYINEILSGIMGNTALLNREKIIELTQPNWTCDDSDFRTVTGYKEQYNLMDGMKQTVDWYREHGWL